MLAGLPPSHSSNGDYRFPLWELIFGRPCVGRSTPPLNGNFRFLFWQSIFHAYSENWYLADLVLADIFPHQMVISQIPALTVHISFSLLSAHIWQTRMGRSTPPPTSNSNYRFLLWELIFGRPSVVRSTPCQIAMIDSYSESWYLADQVLADLHPLEW